MKQRPIGCVTCGIDIEFGYRAIKEFSDWAFQDIRTKEEFIKYLCDISGVVPPTVITKDE